MYQPRGTAFRRHHYQRLKRARVRNNHGGKGYRTQSDWVPSALGIATNTPKAASCFIINNQRETEGPTLAERKSSLSHREWRKDLDKLQDW